MALSLALPRTEMIHMFDFLLHGGLWMTWQARKTQETIHSSNSLYIYIPKFWIIDGSLQPRKDLKVVLCEEHHTLLTFQVTCTFQIRTLRNPTAESSQTTDCLSGAGWFGAKPFPAIPRTPNTSGDN